MEIQVKKMMKEDENKVAVKAAVSKPLTHEEQLLQALFNECVFNERPINWRYWFKQLPTLKAGDAARLMSGLDPRIHKSLDTAQNQHHQGKYCENAEKIQRHAESENKESAQPREWLKWADSYEYEVHYAFRFEIESVNHTQQAAALDSVAIDFRRLATRQKLVDVYGEYTGMNIGWFKSLGDTPALMRARKVLGQKGRASTGPLFCPYEVMLWLIDPKCKKKSNDGKRLEKSSGWRLLKSHFPEVYADHEDHDPRRS